MHFHIAKRKYTVVFLNSHLFAVPTLFRTSNQFNWRNKWIRTKEEKNDKNCIQWREIAKKSFVKFEQHEFYIYLYYWYFYFPCNNRFDLLSSSMVGLVIASCIGIGKRESSVTRTLLTRQWKWIRKRAAHLIIIHLILCFYYFDYCFSCDWLKQRKNNCLSRVFKIESLDVTTNVSRQVVWSSAHSFTYIRSPISLALRCKPILWNVCLCGCARESEDGWLSKSIDKRNYSIVLFTK